MLKKRLNKKGNEILQTLIVVAVIGALAITICVLISSKLKKNAQDNLADVGSGLHNSVETYMPSDKDFSFGADTAGGKKPE